MRPHLALLSVVAACGSAASSARDLPIPPGPPPVLPRLVAETSNHVRLDVRINDLPISRYELVALSEKYPLPALYFHAGKNAASIRYTADPSAYVEQPPTAVVKLAELDEEHSPPYGLPADKRVFAAFPIAFDPCAKGHEGPACTQALEFEIAGALPSWRWTTGDVLTDSPAVRRELLEEHVRLREALWKMVPRDEDGLAVPGKANGPGVRALRDKLYAALADQRASARYLGKDTIDDVEELLALAANPNTGLEELKNLDALALDVFGGGKLARLRTDTIPLLWLAGGAHDAPSGTLGPFSIAFEVWWRRSGGRWELAAIWRTHPMVELPATRR